MRKLNIGNIDFKKLRVNDKYFVDKSLLIKDVLNGSDITLLPHPSRGLFLKTVTSSLNNLACISQTLAVCIPRSLAI